ncbi:D-glycero-beta-D-manno-heptose 1,7-bisphosphate 7-phosphatase [soil metagenome]
MNQNRCIFLDRDGVLNVERGDYTYRPEDFELEERVPEALALLKQYGYLLIVITNQGGIGKKRYTKQDMALCHEKLQQECNHLLDAIYYAPSHPSFSESLSRKPGSLLFEKALARFQIDPAQSWMVGDQLRDLEAAAKVGIRSVLVGQPQADYPRKARNLLEAAQLIVGESERAP